MKIYCNILEIELLKMEKHNVNVISNDLIIVFTIYLEQTRIVVIMPAIDLYCN